MPKNLFAVCTILTLTLMACGSGIEPNTGNQTSTNTATDTGGVAGTGGTTDTGSVSGTGGTGSSTGTGSVTGTSTSTATTVTIPVWFKVGSSQEAILSVLSGAQYANITFVLTKVNADGTWTANTTNCLGSCSGIGKLTGTISETSFKINELSAVGVVPATAPANALTSGTWEFNQSSGTFFTS